MTAERLDVIPSADPTEFFVSSRTAEGAYWRVQLRLGLVGCSCPWGRYAAERVNTRPCAHVQAVREHEERKAV